METLQSKGTYLSVLNPPDIYERESGAHQFLMHSVGWVQPRSHMLTSEDGEALRGDEIW